jgi:predicted phage terminase large subunit-like protein
VLREGTTVRRIAFSACKRFTTVDLAASTEEWADYTVASTFAETPTKDLLWLDCLREKLEGPDQPKLIRSAYEKWNPGYVGVEKHGYQLTFIQALKRAGYPIKALTPDGDKIARAIPLSVLYENGQVYHPIAADWLDAAETELMLFPNAPHDDIVDTAAYAAKQLVAPVGDVSQVKVLGA